MDDRDFDDRDFTVLPLTSGEPAVINPVKDHHEDSREENIQAF
jgi:hypothetical protein